MVQIDREFPTLAHRLKIYKPSRDSVEIVWLRNKYKKIPFIVIGSNPSITNRLDGIIAYVSIIL